MPFVTLKAAVSLDGRIAARSGDSRWVSSAEARDYTHLLRGEHDAILVGSGTVLSDDPRLTVRHAQWRGKRILRVVLDPGLRTPPCARMLSASGVLIFTDRESSARKAAALEGMGAEIVRVPGDAKELDLRAVLGEIGKREITSVLVEGGSRVHTAFIEAGLADKLVCALSPKLIGGQKAVSFFEGAGARTMAAALRLRDDPELSGGRRPDDRGVLLMFTGIITSMGVFQGYRKGRTEILIEAPEAAPKLEPGASLAVDGVCLSLVRRDGSGLVFGLSRETLEKTTLGLLRTGDRLNLELPLTPASLLSGHLVSGHVDAVGKVARIAARGPGKRLTVSFPPELAPYFVLKRIGGRQRSEPDRRLRRRGTPSRRSSSP